MVQSLYIHIPFCLQKCAYCDFYSIPIEENVARRYAHALAQEIRTQARGTLGTLYIGGGTPTVLPEDSLEEILASARETFALAPDAEISIEANPGTIDAQKAEALRSLDINRISLGVQSFHDDELQSLGRAHTAQQAIEAIEHIKGAFANVSLDLIYGVPGQSLTSLRGSLEQAIELGPTHISAYELTPEPGTPLTASLGRGDIVLPDEDTAVEMAGLVQETLGLAGYQRYEVSNYARPGYECRHNLNYWLRGQYYGCGASAHAFIDNHRTRNVADAATYIEMIERGQMPIEKRESVSHEEALREHVFLGLRLTRGVDIERFRRELGLDLLPAAGTFIEDGFMAHEEGMLRLTDKGMLLFNPVVARFLEALGL